MIAEQVRSTHGDVFPENVGGAPFSREIERIQGILLRSGRFKGTLGSSLVNTVFSRLCIDPVYRKTCTDTCVITLRLNGVWSKTSCFSYAVSDPMARDAADDVADYNLLAGKGTDRRRFAHFLLPLIEERCWMLGMHSVEPSQELLDLLMLTNAVSRNGKPGRPVYEFEFPYTSWMETLDDLKKSISYSIVRYCVDAGGVLVAVSGDSFIVDAERGVAEDMKVIISTVIQNAAEQVLGLKADEFGNFVEVTELSAWPLAGQDQEVRS